MTFRTPRYEDLDDFLGLINSLVEEEAQVDRREKVTREQEKKWLINILASLEQDEIFFLVAEVEGKIIAASHIQYQIQSEDKESLGVIGLAVKNGYRNIGIGYEILKIHTEQAKRVGLKNLVLYVFATNSHAIHLYEKAGFVKASTNPNKHIWKGLKVDEIKLVKPIK